MGTAEQGIPSIVRTARAEPFVSRETLAETVGISVETLEHMVHLGLIAPTVRDATEFPAGVVRRLRRVLRLHEDLGLALDDAAIVVDLLERLEYLEAELARRPAQER